MGFEELTRKITDTKDKEMAMEFTNTIGKLLKEKRSDSTLFRM